jgi:transcriptional regulator with XRE-family HTH domain
MNLHERVRAARKHLNATQESLAALTGVTRGAVAQWEMPNGTAPSVENLIKIATISGVGFEWLATGRGPRTLGDAATVREPQRPDYAAADPLDVALRAAIARLPEAKRRALLELLRK